ncbi:hypothetical protein BKI52_11830 [marine bacterium AO1-C]|nr:hypothetical protein BKI52_11830 [marine bacterium AO1-C]
MSENTTLQIKTLLAQNRKSEAVSLAFEQIGNLSEAKSFIAALEQELSAPVTQEIVKLETDIVHEDPLESIPTPDMEEIKAQALVLLDLGRKIEAIKWVKEQTNWGLKESKLYIDDLPSQNIVPEEVLDTVPPPDMDKIKKHVLQLTQEGLKLKAVKWVREQLGWGLKESKLYVDNLQDQNK